MKVALYTIVKNENTYIREFVEYYQKMGFDKIIMVDNNDEENLSDVIDDYIRSDFVEVASCRNRICDQDVILKKTFIERIYKKYDWFAVFDADEYLELNKHKDIKEFLSDPRYKNYVGISINWENYGDSGLVEPEINKPLRRRFTEPAECYIYNRDFDRDDKQVKTISRADILFDFKSHANHKRRYIGKKLCDADGNEISFDKPKNYCLDHTTYKTAKIRHYITKTIGEFIYRKLQHSFKHSRENNIKRIYEYAKAFKVCNHITKEKIDLIVRIWGNLLSEEEISDLYTLVDK